MAFRHPTGGCQLVKGNIEDGEEPARAAERELFEESGLLGIARRDLGTLFPVKPRQEWRMFECHVETVAEKWTHHASDGGGLDFAFFGHPLERMPDEEWQPVFLQALNFIRSKLQE